MSTGTTPALQKLALEDIQFGTNYDPVKMQQMVQALVTAGTTVNALMDQVQSLQGQINTNSGQTARHALATETGLGPEHTVSGLEAGQALVATSPTSAEFTALNLTQLGDVNADSFEDPTNGQVVGWLDGQLALQDQSTQDLNQSIITLTPETTSLPLSRKLVAGTNVTIDASTPGQVVINATAGSGGTINDIDGGFANTVYLFGQNLDGGFANTVYSQPPVDGGGA